MADETMMMETKTLINVLEGGELQQISVDKLIDKASRNKVLLHVLRTLNIQGPLRRSQESDMERVVKVVRVISKTLKRYDHAFFKLNKPVAYVPADADLIVKTNQIKEAAKEIMKLGYGIAAKDPYCITLTKGKSIVDLYTHPSLGGAILIDGQELLEHTTTINYNGVEVRSLKEYAEALVATSHAIYKEKTYTLNDYFTVKKWMNSKTLKLAERLKCLTALRLALRINESVDEGRIELPYKPVTALWISLLSKKLIEDPLTRSTSGNLLRALISRRGPKLLISKLVRETY